MINTGEFRNLIREIVRDEIGDKSLYKIGEVASIGDKVSVIFSGEPEPTQKEYTYLESYYPVVGDRVILLKDKGTYVILGKINKLLSDPLYTGKDIVVDGDIYANDEIIQQHPITSKTGRHKGSITDCDEAKAMETGIYYSVQETLNRPTAFNFGLLETIRRSGTEVVQRMSDVLSNYGVWFRRWQVDRGWSDWVRLVDSSQFSYSKTGNGYQMFCSGVIIQWGSLSFTQGSSVHLDRYITFPISFPNRCINVQWDIGPEGNPGWLSSGTRNLVSVSSDRTRLMHYNGMVEGRAYRVYWFAIGY